MASCEHLQRTSMYFDGELAPADEREAADHLATCEACHALPSDAVGPDARWSPAPAVVTPIARVGSRRRWQLAVAAAAVIAAAAIAIIVLRPKPPDKPDRVALV